MSESSPGSPSESSSNARPLAGRTIALPETRELDRLGQMLEEEGARTWRCPLVAILDAPDQAPVEAWVRALVAGVRVIDSDGLAPDAVITNLRALLPLLRDSGVILCAENHLRFSPQTVRRIVCAVDDPAVGVCLDPLNSIAQWIGPEETIRELAPLARTAQSPGQGG